MDPSIQALISAMAENHAAAMAQYQQGQQAFMERLGHMMAGQANGPVRQTPERVSLVDPHGVGKPPALTGKTANDPVSFRAWRIKFRSWVVAGIPEAAEVMERLEGQKQ